MPRGNLESIFLRLTMLQKLTEFIENTVSQLHNKNSFISYLNLLLNHLTVVGLSLTGDLLVGDAYFVGDPLIGDDSLISLPNNVL